MRSTKALIVVIAVLAAAPAAAESVLLARSTNAAIVGATGTIVPDGTFGAAAHAGFSIAGVLQLGFVYGVTHGPAPEAREAGIGMTYSATPLKQSAVIPFSVQLYGSFTTQTMESQWLRDARLEKSGRELTIGLLLARDIVFSRAFALRVGATGRQVYDRRQTNVTFTFNPDQYTGPLPVDYTQYPLSERITSFLYGGHVAAVYVAPHGNTVQIGVTALLDRAMELQLHPMVQLAFRR
jgi:hypothetical protein